MCYYQTFSWIADQRVIEPIVQVCAEPGEDSYDYGWQSYLVLPQS